MCGDCKNVMTFEEILNQKGILIYTNTGVSMLPLLREKRDIMVIVRRDNKKLRKYDVVLFVRPYTEGRGRYVLHRILKVYDGGYFVAGDNCISGEYVPEKNVLGVLSTVIRNGKPDDFHSQRYWLYVHLWCAPYHFRFCCLSLRNFSRRYFIALWHRIIRHR